MTRTEAAERLYEATRGLSSYWINPLMGETKFGATLNTVRAALDAYSTATPDALPAEVARVVEAAEKWWDATREDFFADEVRRELRLAVRAYRSSQPDPLPARLARLRPGSVVELARAPHATVIANHPATETLFIEWKWNGEIKSNAAVYSSIRAILSESP